jgi:hypothetical protein
MSIPRAWVGRIIVGIPQGQGVMLVARRSEAGNIDIWPGRDVIAFNKFSGTPALGWSCAMLGLLYSILQSRSKLHRLFVCAVTYATVLLELLPKLQVCKVADAAVEVECMAIILIRSTLATSVHSLRFSMIGSKIRPL